MENICIQKVQTIIKLRRFFISHLVIFKEHKAFRC